jgi:hypothetical protein
MFLFRVIGWQLYKPEPPNVLDKFKSSDVTLIIPTIDTDEEAMHEAMRSWVLNEPFEILIITVGEALQKELQHIANTSIAADITRVLYVEKPANKRIQLVHGASWTTSRSACPQCVQSGNAACVGLHRGRTSCPTLGTSEPFPKSKCCSFSQE